MKVVSDSIANKVILINVHSPQLTNSTAFLHRLFSNEKLTGALKNMCANLFPSFSQAQLTGGALEGSAYASGFSEACKQFSPALKSVSPEKWYLVFGLPIGGLTMGGLSMCLAVLPNCGSNSESYFCFPSFIM